MHFTRGEIRERNIFTDKSLDAARVAFEHPDLIKFQGRTAISAYRQLLDEAVVANYGDTGIELPAEVPPDTDRLVVVAVSRQEIPLMSAKLGIQTVAQRKATIKTFESWGAEAANDYYGSFGFSAARSDDKPTPYPISPLTRAMTGSFVSFLNLSNQHTRANLPSPPREGIVQINQRPIIMIVMGKKPHAAGEVLAHELVHVRQITKEPVRIFHSQKSIDMTSLRDELEAYHLGADVAYIENGCRPVDLILANGSADLDKRLQSVVESLRRAHGVDPLDPYRPSPSLLKLMRGLGEMILHKGLDFNDLEALFND